MCDQGKKTEKVDVIWHCQHVVEVIGLFIWFDEVGRFGGAGYSKEEAHKQMKRYVGSLDVKNTDHSSMSMSPRHMMDNAGTASQHLPLVDDVVVHAAVLRSVAQYLELNWACTNKELGDACLERAKAVENGRSCDV